MLLNSTDSCLPHRCTSSDQQSHCTGCWGSKDGDGDVGGPCTAGVLSETASMDLHQEWVSTSNSTTCSKATQPIDQNSHSERQERLPPKPENFYKITPTCMSWKLSSSKFCSASLLYWQCCCKHDQFSWKISSKHCFWPWDLLTGSSIPLTSAPFVFQAHVWPEIDTFCGGSR